MKIHLTFDIDWAPDWIIEEVLTILDLKKVKGTFFITHETPLNREIALRGHNLGIHPNFLPGSSHGKNVFEIINFFNKLLPNATCIRTHSLFQSSPLLEEIFTIKSSLTYDFSLFTPGLGLYKKIIWHNENIKFWRLNYQWEDDCCFPFINYSWDKLKLENSLNIINFHPIHVYLNSNNGMNYAKLKRRLRGKNLQNAKKSDFEGIINMKQGVKNSLLNAINSEYHCINFEDLLCELE